MTTTVVGGGLIGLTTAYALQVRGEPVHLVDALGGVALETSFANAGLITPSMPEPWNGPGVFGHLLKSLFDARSGLGVRPSAIPGLAGWGLRFIANAAPGRHFAACTDNYRLASYSLEQTTRITEALELDYDRGTAGTLSVFRDRKAFEAKRAVVDHVAALGMTYDLLSPAEVAELVPQMAAATSTISCGIRYPGDHYGDAHRFCRSLYPHFLAAGGTARFASRVEALVVANDKIRALRVDGEEIDADRVVVAAGAASPELLLPLGLLLPVKPAKGYSVTIDFDDPTGLPALPVIDDELHVCLTPLGSRLRLVGAAEFAGFDKRIDAARTEGLIGAFRSLMPELSEDADVGNAQRWAGLRPMSHDGRPFIGPTPVSGLYVNSGHGPLGWTMAAGSAEVLADLVLGETPAIDARPFAVTRA